MSPDTSDALPVAILTGVFMLALIGGLALFLEKFYWPKTIRRDILKSLETTEVIGVSDIGSNIHRVYKRWRLLQLGVEQTQQYQLESYVTRIEAALETMKSVQGDLEWQAHWEDTNPRLWIYGRR